MQKYQETVISSIGRPVVGASVRVVTLAGAAATIYSDNGVTPITSLVTDSTGSFGFYAADGRYTVTISGTGFPTRVITDVLLEDPADGNAALAVSNGSSLIGFIQSGAGAQSRTSQQKLREFVSPFDFGAISDGSSHPLSGRYATLALAQADYPFVTALTQEIDWAACQAAINAASSFATFSYASPSPPYSSPYWAAATNPLLRFPRGFYELGTDQLLWTGDNIVADLRGAVFNYRGTGGAFRWAHLTYGDLLGGQVQLFSDTVDTYGLHLDGANRWNVWRDFLITYSGTYNTGTFSKPVASNNIGIYGNSGGAAPDAVTFARDNIYNHFENYRIEKCGWNVKLLNDPASPSGGGAVLAQNVFRKGVHHARNGLWLAGVKGDRFLDIVQESSDAASVSLRIKASGVNTCQYNLLDFQHWEYANGTTFDIDASCTYNDFRCQLDPFANFPSLATLGKYQQYRTNTEHQQVTSAGDRIVLNTSGQFVVSRSDSSYTPVSSYQFQNEKNTLFGSSGGNNNHRAHVGTNEQYVIAQDGGVGGMSLMGGGATSSANLVFGNSFTTTPTERWRQWLDGSDNSLNFGQGFTWKSAAGTPAVKFSSIGAIAAMNATAIPAGGTTGAGLKVSSTANFGIFFGSGAPTLSAAKGSLYLRSDGSSTSTRAYINTDGATTWTAITTVA